MTENENALAESQAQRLEHVSQQLTTLLRERDAERRKHSALGDAEWSGMQIVGHVVEMVPYWLAHAENIIAATEPPAFGRTLESPERLAGPEHGASTDLEELLAQLQATTQAAAQRIRTLSPADRAKKGIHNRRGEMTAGDVIETFVVTHAEEHLAQAQSA